MAENKKIRNATKSKLGNITFKSQLEKMAYRTLTELGFNPQYEPKTFVVWEGYESKIPFYDKETDTQRLKRDENSPKLLTLKSNKIQPIRYTPDFYLRYDNIDIWIEMKGVENDLAYIKKKLFRKYLDNLYMLKGQFSIYFEIYNKRQLLQAIDIIKEYEQRINKEADRQSYGSS